MIRLARAELFKLRTTPGPWVVIFVTVLLTSIGIVTSFLAQKFGGNGVQFIAPDTQNRLRQLVGAGYQGGIIAAPILGVLCITSEYRHKVITTTLLITPRRAQVLGAKSIATIVWSIGMCLFAFAMVGALGIPLFISQNGSLHDLFNQVAPVAPGLFGAFVLLALFGLGVGTLMKNQVASVLIIIIVTIVLEPLIVLLVHALAHIDLNWLPSAAAAAVSGGLHRGGEGNNGAGPLLNWWLGGLALLGWGLVPATIGYFTTFRHDVT